MLALGLHCWTGSGPSLWVGAGARLSLSEADGHQLGFATGDGNIDWLGCGFHSQSELEHLKTSKCPAQHG